MNQIEQAKKKLENDLLLFGKVCSPNTFVVKSPAFHYELADVWKDKTLDRVNIIAPRGHAKSSLAKLMMLHHLMFGETKIKFIVIMSRTEGHAKRLLADVKNILEYSQTFKDIFGYHGKEVSKKWTDAEIELDNNSIILCRGASQQVVGLNHLSQRPTLFFYDDPEDENNTKNKESMDNTLNILLKMVEPGVDPKSGRIFIIGTPQREGCLVEKIKEMPSYYTRHYDAIVDETKKKVLWAEWMSWDKLMDKKKTYEAINKLSVFYSEYRCQLIGDENQLFPAVDFRYWDGEFKLENNDAYIKITKTGKNERDGLDLVLNWTNKENPEWEPINVFMGVDPASSVSSTADYSVIMPVGVDKDRNLYVLPYYRKRVKPMGLAQTIIGYFKKYRPQKTNIETTGYQEMLRDYLRNESEVYIPGLEIKNNPRNSKSQRLETLQPFFFNHKIHMKEGMSELENELTLYPRTSHDDTLDALYYAKKSIYVPSHQESGKVEKVFKKVSNWITM